jgi:hypothetical protein
MSFVSSLKGIIRPDHARYEGVRRINIYLMRLLYLLIAFNLGKMAWTHILTHEGTWELKDAMAWSVWAAFSAMAALGIFHPLEMLPLLLFEILYKSLWLLLVAYPLWNAHKLAGSTAEDMTNVFLPAVIVTIAVIPWHYAFCSYVINLRSGRDRVATRTL